MSDLTEQHCEPCEGGVAPMNAAEVTEALKKLKGWSANDAATCISKSFKFKNFYQTMAFVNAVAFIANQQNHHPDLTVGYDKCHIEYSTHAIDGLSINDFICAARIDQLSN